MVAPPVLIVTLAGCEACAEAEAFFAERGIVPTVVAFDEASIDLRRQIAAYMRAEQVAGFPIVIVGRTAVFGYSPLIFEQLLSMN